MTDIDPYPDTAAQDVPPNPASAGRMFVAAAAAPRRALRSPAEALAWAKRQARWESGMCLQFVRSCYGVPAVHRTAQIAWEHTEHRHTSTPPPGVPVWWTGGRRGFGHVAISEGDGYVISTDVPSSGRVGRIAIRSLTAAWGHRYRGWSEDINGYRITTTTPDPEDDDMTPAQAAQLARIAEDTAYIRRQNVSIARAIVAFARGDELTAAELKAVQDAAAGRG